MALQYVKVKENNTVGDYLLKLIKEDENYIATYYQLEKLYESLNELEKAKGIYKNEIEIAQQIEHKKTLIQLQEAHTRLIEIDEDECDSYRI